MTMSEKAARDTDSHHTPEQTDEDTDTESDIGGDGMFGGRKEQVGNLREDPIQNGGSTQRTQQESNGVRDPVNDIDSNIRPDGETIQERGLRQAVIKQKQEEGILSEDPTPTELAHIKYEEPETDLERLKLIDNYLDALDEDLPLAKERERAGDYYQVVDKFRQDITTQDKLCFDYVQDDGIIVHGDTYYGLQKVDPVRWTSKDDEQKMNIVKAYIAFLKSLQWSIAIPTYPKEFDFSKYLWNIYEAGAKEERNGVHPIIDYGRRNHILWTNEKIDPDKVKKKEFYLVVPVEEETMEDTLAGRKGGSLFSAAIGGVMGLFGSDEEDVDLERACLTEIRDRQDQMRKELTRTGVQVDRVDSRKEAMSILYYYYNHMEPVLDELNDGTTPETDFSNLTE
jgi:hypothetical protein